MGIGTLQSLIVAELSLMFRQVLGIAKASGYYSWGYDYVPGYCCPAGGADR